MNGQPVEATEGNSPYDDGVLSFLPGQRLSRCTCSGESHPGPKHDNGEYVGRSAPEIDMFEAQVRTYISYFIHPFETGRRLPRLVVRN